MTERVLVTGGAGYIGSHTCKALAEAGFQPTVFDNLSTGHESFVKWGPLIVGDVRDGSSIARAIHDVRPSAVLHFAGLAIVAESVADPGPYYDVNIAGVLRVLEAMVGASCNKLIFSSTCAVYGVPSGTPISETTLESPVSPYGATKLSAERAIAGFDVAHRLRSVCLRYFNAAGADSDGEIGERHDPETRLLPVAIRAALGIAPPVKIFGSDYPTLDGTAIRDYVHVSDLAVGHVSALTYLLRGGLSQTLNLGTGRGTSVAEMIAAVEDATGLRVPSIVAARREGDPPALVADPSRAMRVVGWQPTQSTLARIVEDAVQWHQREADREGEKGQPRVVDGGSRRRDWLGPVNA